MRDWGLLYQRPPVHTDAILLAVALGYAEVLGAGDIFIGVNAVDYSGYPDCRPQFIAAFERLANLATRLDTLLA